jgi:hypothetical protein
MDEIWKPIPNFDGLYEVSNLGNVRSLDKFVNHINGNKALRKGRLLKQDLSNAGYLRVTLSNNRKLFSFSVHRLVAIAFLDTKNLPQVNHKDCIKTNNTLENLEWVTREQNMQHAVKNNRLPKHMTNKFNMFAKNNPNKARKMNNEKAELIRAMSREGIAYRRIAEKLDISLGTVWKIVTNKSW